MLRVRRHRVRLGSDGEPQRHHPLDVPAQGPALLDNEANRAAAVFGLTYEQPPTPPQLIDRNGGSVVTVAALDGHVVGGGIDVEYLEERCRRERRGLEAIGIDPRKPAQVSRVDLGGGAGQAVYLETAVAATTDCHRGRVPYRTSVTESLAARVGEDRALRSRL